MTFSIVGRSQDGAALGGRPDPATLLPAGRA
jgi:hypothetical protein